MDPKLRTWLMLDIPEPPRFGDGREPWADKEVWEWCFVAAHLFIEWEAEFFQVRGRPYYRNEFHVEWIIEILYAIFTGGYLQIMSPPRHGKSELLVHFCMWLLSRDPNFQIIWIGGAEKIAQKMVNMAKRNLEHNRHLVEMSLPPGVTWAPRNKGAGATWGNGQFIVSNRTALELKSDSMMAYGREGTILSIDADLIICDDIESHKSTKQAGNRRSTKSWFNNDLDSRKEEHTAMVVIGSRQHPDDVYGFNMDSPDWRYVVNSAHSLDCKLDPEDLDIHTDCVLFPELRSYRWLMTKRRRSDLDEEAGAPYEMIYLNDPLADGFSIFTAEEIGKSYNQSRILGTDGIPPKGRRMIAGLDPSATGYQAGFCWAVTPYQTLTTDYAPELQDFSMKRWMVDLDNHLGGGIENALELFEMWLKLYDVKHWVIEDNGFQALYLDDPRVKVFSKRHDVYFESHKTYGNKNDPLYGVGAMTRLFRDELIDLPMGDSRSREKVGIYRRQLLNFSEADGRNSKLKTDVHMSSWFPQKTIRRWEKEAIVANVHTESTNMPYPQSYAGLQGFSGLQKAPW